MWFRLFLIAFLFSLQVSGQRMVLEEGQKETHVSDKAVFFSSPPDAELDLAQALIHLSNEEFLPLEFLPNEKHKGDHWVYFEVENLQELSSSMYLSVIFTDFVDIYSRDSLGMWHFLERSGDLVPVNERSVPVGEFAYALLALPPGATGAFMLRLHSQRTISYDFRKFALKAINLHSENSFAKRQGKARIYQALFYGALIIMLLYNLIIFFTLGARSYLFYVLFLFLLIIFLSANIGYLNELIWGHSPAIDVYSRLLSAPLLIAAYLLFGKSFLRPEEYSKAWSRVLNALIAFYLLMIFLSIMGLWAQSRSVIIIGAAFSFIAVFALAIYVYRKGFTPARYFLAANALLLIGGVVYALSRFYGTVQNPVSTYSIQISAVFQVALFSIGLADRINLTRRQLAEKILENERLETKRVSEIKEIIEKKNIELEQKVIERTAEVVAQKEEIESQKENLESQNKELEKATQIIQEQNEKLANVNLSLEKKVEERTIELKRLNEQLDTFIYKTAHDIRGPLARLLGLCQVALLDVSEEKAQEYLQKLNANANNLDYILKRLSTAHEISTLEPGKESIDFEAIIFAIEKKLPFFDEEAVFSIKSTINISSDFRSDAGLIKFVLSNLIENAVKFRKPGQAVNIMLDIRQNAQKVVIQVMDDGEGIQEVFISGLFDMFSKAALQNKKSTGLGLYLVKLALDKIGGSIHLQSTGEAGTVFEVQLPV